MFVSAASSGPHSDRYSSMSTSSRGRTSSNARYNPSSSCGAGRSNNDCGNGDVAGSACAEMANAIRAARRLLNTPKSPAWATSISRSRRDAAASGSPHGDDRAVADARQLDRVNSDGQQVVRPGWKWSPIATDTRSRMCASQMIGSRRCSNTGSRLLAPKWSERRRGKTRSHHPTGLCLSAPSRFQGYREPGLSCCRRGEIRHGLAGTHARCEPAGESQCSAETAASTVWQTGHNAGWGTGADSPPTNMMYMLLWAIVALL